MFQRSEYPKLIHNCYWIMRLGLIRDQLVSLLRCQTSRVVVRLKLNAQKRNLGRKIFIEFAIFIALVAKLNESNNTTSNIRHLCEIRTTDV
jgi:hypothetical protein